MSKPCSTPAVLVRNAGTVFSFPTIPLNDICQWAYKFLFRIIPLSAPEPLPIPATGLWNGYETGAREPKSDFWVAVAQKYNVTIDYLMGYSDDPHGTVAGTSRAPSVFARRLAEIASANHLLKTLVDQYEGNQENLLDGISQLSEEDREALIDASLTIITAVRSGEATVGKPATPPTDGRPQEGKADAPEMPPEGE